MLLMAEVKGVEMAEEKGLEMAEEKGVEVAEEIGVENVPPQQFPAQLLKRPVQKPTNKTVAKKRKECQKEVKSNKANEIAAADSGVT